VIAAGTRRLTGELFEYRDLSAIELKGIAEPVSVWQALRQSAVESRFEALRGSTLSPLVGREEEIDLLLRRWARAKAGDGQVVLISGEPGIGKSRLAAELAERLHAEPRIVEFIPPGRGRIVARKACGPAGLVDEWKERAVLVIGRAEIA